MTRPSLAGIEQRTAAATEEPWEVNGPDEDWAVIHSGPDSVIHAYTVHDPDCEGCTCGGDEAGHVAISVEDAEFIADARTAVPALLAAVRDVLALHTDGGQSQGYTHDAPGGYGYIDHCCTECGSFGEFGEPWPCPTVRALAAHLDLTDPEGDPT